MGIVGWIILGLIAGVVAKWLMPGKGPTTWVWTILLGITGALVGGFLGRQIGFGDIHEFDLRSLFLATGGAVLVLFVYDRFLRK